MKELLKLSRAVDQLKPLSVGSSRADRTVTTCLRRAGTPESSLRGKGDAPGSTFGPVDDDLAVQESQRDDAALTKKGPIWLVVGLLAFGLIVIVVVRWRRAPRQGRTTDDLSVAVMEYLAAVGDSIASFQEPVACEAYLGSAESPSSSRWRTVIGRDSDDRDRLSRMPTDDLCGTTVRFGDGVSGAVPLSDANAVTGVYRAGMGRAGNVGREGEEGDGLAVLGIWDRSVLSSDDPTLPHAALGCTDTSSRTRSPRGRSSSSLGRVRIEGPWLDRNELGAFGGAIPRLH